MPIVDLSKRESYEEQNVGPSIKSLAWTLAAISVIIVAMRFYVRAFMIRRVKWDDWTMLLSLVLGIVNTSFVQVSIDYGLGRHIKTLDPMDAMNAIKWDYMAQPTAIMAPAFGRISFALLLLNIVGKDQGRRYFLYGVMATQFVINSLTFIFILVQCTPIQLLWDKRLEGKGSCWDLRVQEYFGYFQGSFNTVTDFILAVAPAVVVWHLNMKLSMKISLICLMGLGIFAMVGSIVKTILLKSVGSNNDYTYNTAFLIIWWTIELYLVIIAASIPTLKPLIPKRGNTTQGSGGVKSGASYNMKRFNSRPGQAGYTSTTTPAADHFPVPAGGGNDSYSYSADDGSSLTKILAPEATHPDERDIRKTVNVSVVHGAAMPNHGH